MDMETNTIKQCRIKVADSYYAQGYGRGVNKRNVYEIDGEFYAFHPEYARQAFEQLPDEFKGYIKVSRLKSGNDYIYAA